MFLVADLGVSVVVENTTSAANRFTRRTVKTVLRTGVLAARGRACALQTDVPVLAPVHGPRVAHDPVVLAVVGAVADRLHGVVNVRVRLVAAVVDTGLVEVPRGGVDADGDGALVGEGVHEVVVAVRLDNGVVRKLHEGIRRAVVGVLALVVGAVPRVVGVAELRRETAVLHEEVEGDDLAAALTATLALDQAARGDGRARGDLLGGEVHDLARLEIPEGLDRLSRGKRPARAAVALVLDGRHGTLEAPVLRRGEVGQRALGRVQRPAALEMGRLRAAVTAEGLLSSSTVRSARWFTPSFQERPLRLCSRIVLRLLLKMPSRSFSSEGDEYVRPCSFLKCAKP
eukprot:PhM_4_TR11656/c5_g1_i2/m.16414